MSVVQFKFDKERDLKNIWETANSKNDYGYVFKKGVTQNILDICEGEEYERCRNELLKTMSSLYSNLLVDEIVNAMNKSWAIVEKEYFKRLEKITKKKFPFKGVNAYLTTASRCPYNSDSKDPSFYFNFFGSIISEPHTAGHELMHIHLHNSEWWLNVEKELGNKKTHDLKEAMTELLNLEFRDLWIIDDLGYPNHQELRKFINKEWKKKKDFNLLTDKCIKWIKKNWRNKK